MPEYQPLDYRLRCHTKRTDLPPDVLRDIGEAYEAIGRLTAERDEARRMACGHGEYIGGAMIEADLLGWDCFKDKKNV